MLLAVKNLTFSPLCNTCNSSIWESKCKQDLAVEKTLVYHFDMPQGREVNDHKSLFNLLT